MKTSPEEHDLLLMRYLDGALDEASRSELESMLEDDPKAAIRLTVLAYDRVALRGLLKNSAVAEAGRTPEKPGRRFPPRFSRPRPSRRRWVVAGALSAAAILLLLAIAYWALPSGLRLEEGLVAVGGLETSRVREGERFTVSGNRSATLRLADGSRVKLEADSVGVAHGGTKGARQVFELIRGKGRFKVEKAMGGFRVETPAGKVTVLGTEFDVELRPGAQRGGREMTGRTALTLVVAVIVGSVQVEWSGGTVTLSAGQQQVFAAEGDDATVPKVEAKRPEAAGKSYTGKVIANNTGVKFFIKGWDGPMPVKLDGNGKELGKRFNGKTVTLKAELIKKPRYLLMVTELPKGVD